MKRAVLSALTCVVMFASGVVHALDTKINLWVSWQGQERVALDKALLAFKKERPDLVVVIDEIKPDDLTSRLLDSIPKKKGPDLFLMPHYSLGLAVEQGAIIEALDFYIEDMATEGYISDAIEAVSYGDVLYGLPVSASTLALYYNKKRLLQPPVNTIELVKTANASRNLNDSGYPLGWLYTDYRFLAPLFHSFGGSAFANPTTPQINSSNNVAALQLIVGWLENKKMLPPTPSHSSLGAMFNAGSLDMLVEEPWFANRISADISWDVAPLPKLSERQDSPMKPWSTITGAFISSESLYKDEAYMVLRYLSGVKAQNILAKEGRLLPTKTAVYAAPELADSSFFGFFKQQLSDSIVMGNFPQIDMLWQPISQAISAATSGNSSAAKALDLAQKSVEAKVSTLR